ncbi:MAG: yocK [Pedosphaera sp.]|nr:yocK [Pedosphaera sp.]
MEKKKPKAARPTAARGRVRAAASTRDVVKPPPKPPRINPKWESQYRHLTDLRNHFLRQRGMLTQDANEEQPSYSEHMADAGTDSYDRDFALGMLSSDQNALYEIDQAIRRIENGTYGICELTGRPIQRERLIAVPWARFSLDAEQQLEQRGAVNRTRLGALGSVSEAGANENEEEPPEKEPAEGSNENNS